MKGKDGVSLEKTILRNINEIDMLMESSKNHMEQIKQLKEIQLHTLNKTAVVKYDAFKEMGGKLSFALAMHGSGKQWICTECDPQQRRLLHIHQRDCKRRILYCSWRRRKRSAETGSEHVCGIKIYQM